LPLRAELGRRGGTSIRARICLQVLFFCKHFAQSFHEVEERKKKNR
jgi:hypothetical protein